MTLLRTLGIGGLCFAAGYCTCHSREQSRPSLEQHITEDKVISNEDVKTFFHFLQRYEGASLSAPETKEKKSPFSVDNLWDNLPSETKLKLVKQIALSQAERGYTAVKGQTHSMYEELRHYVQKQIGGGQ